MNGNPTGHPPPEIEIARSLFTEYWGSFGFTPCFQHFGEEVAALPGAYSPPNGRLGIAYVNGAPAGCIALRRFDATRCEAKRLYVRSQYRGSGIGYSLMAWLIAEARSAGYVQLLGDTMPVMNTALRLYERMGFERVAPYSADPTPGAICIRLDLTSRSETGVREIAARAD